MSTHRNPWTARAGLTLLLIGLSAQGAPVVEKLGYQGRLLNADGSAATGTTTVSFGLYDVPSGGMALSPPVTLQVALTNGYFAVQLEFPASAFDGTERWLEVTPASDAGTPLSPRQPITSVAHAYRATEAFNLSGGNVNASQVQVGGTTVINSGGAVTATALNVAGNTIVDPAGQIDWTRLKNVAVTANAPLTGSGTSSAPLSLPPASAAVDGYLASADWSSFNGKLAAVSHDASLVGNGTAASPLGLLQSCTPGQVLSWNGTAWACTSPAASTGGTVTSLTPGTGITLSSNPLTVAGSVGIDPAVVPRLGAANSFSVGGQSIATGAPAATGLMVKGAPGQSANLQEWQDGSGALLSAVNAAGAFTGNVLGNAATATNGVVTTGSYADPGWMTSLAGSKITGAVANATSAVSFTGALGGDVTGTQSATVVGKVQTIPVAALSPSVEGQMLRFNNGAGRWEPGTDGSALTALNPASLSPGTASINISGNAATVTNGVVTTASYSDPAWLTSLSGAKIAGDIAGNAGTVTNGVYTTGSYADPAWLTALSGAKISGPVPSATTAASFSGALGGDVTGTQSATVVAKLRGADLSATAPSADGQVLRYNLASTRWEPSTDGSALTALNPANLSPGTAGIDISGNAATATNGVVTTGSYSDPAWLTALSGAKVSGNIAGLAANVSGVVGPANGGTGLDTSATLAGALLHTSATGAWSTLPVGSNGQVLTVTAGLPAWAPPSSAGVTSIGAGTAITIGGTASVPTVGVVFGAVAGTAAQGNDARLSDARAPLSGSAFYLQNQTASPQAASFNLSGSGALAGPLGVGTTSPNAAALVELTSTARGFLPPRMTTAQVNAIVSPPAGLMVFDTTLNCLAYYSGAQWLYTCGSCSAGGSASASPAALCSGNTSTLSLTGYLGNIQWQSSADGLAWSNIGGATAASYTTPALGSTTYYRASVAAVGCATAASTAASVTVSASPAGGTVSPSSIGIASNTSTTLNVSGTSGTLQWQSSTDNVTFTNTGVTTTSFTTPNLTVTTYYRVLASTVSCGTALSNVATVAIANPINWNFDSGAQGWVVTDSGLTGHYVTEGVTPIGSAYCGGIGVGTNCFEANGYYVNSSNYLQLESPVVLLHSNTLTFRASLVYQAWICRQSTGVCTEFLNSNANLLPAGCTRSASGTCAPGTDYLTTCNAGSADFSALGLVGQNIWFRFRSLSPNQGGSTCGEQMAVDSLAN